MNKIDIHSINVIFGAQMLDVETVNALPANTIIYNLEQLAGIENKVRPSMIEAAKRFALWDYSTHNMEAWRTLGLGRSVHHLPIGYAPILTRIPKQEEDIDVLIYGLPSGRRLSLFARLCAEGLTSVYLCGLYGAARDSLIARSKLIVNATLYEQSRIFEMVRVSYLLANRKAVVAEILPGARLEEGLEEAVAYATPEEVVSTCERLISDDSARRALEEEGFQTIARRDIARLLFDVLTV